jgi:hypothetical protein
MVSPQEAVEMHVKIAMGALSGRGPGGGFIAANPLMANKIFSRPTSTSAQ